MNTYCHTVCCMLSTWPQLGVRFLADSNSWNGNGTPNLRTVRQILRVLSQVTSDIDFAQPSILTYVGLLWTKFQVPNFLFSSLSQHGSLRIENVGYQQLQNIGRETVCRINVWGIWEKYPFSTPKNCLLIHLHVTTLTIVCCWGRTGWDGHKQQVQKSTSAGFSHEQPIYFPSRRTGVEADNFWGFKG